MRNLNKLAIALALAGTSLTAQATVVTEWSYSTLASFISADTTFSSNTDGTTYSSPAVLSWGSTLVSATTPSSGVDRSYLTIGNGSGSNGLYNGLAATGTATTGGGAAVGDIFTHWNNTISGNYRTLTGGTVHDTLTLTPVLPGAGASVAAPTLDFLFHFVETSNGINNASCPGNNVGSTTPCGDLFGFQGTPNFNLGFQYGADEAYGDGKDEQYYASVIVFDPQSLSEIPIYWLNDGQCAALGFSSGSVTATTQSHLCQGFITNEEKINQVQFGFAITSVPINVPEPSMPAMIGVAMFALGLSRRLLRKA